MKRLVTAALLDCSPRPSSAHGKNWPVSFPPWQPGVPAVQVPPGFTVGVFAGLLPPDDPPELLGLDEPDEPEDPDDFAWPDDFEEPDFPCDLEPEDVCEDPDEPEELGVLLPLGEPVDPAVPPALLPPPPPLTVTLIGLLDGLLEPDSPIRTPTPSAISRVATPATRVALGDQLERRGGAPEDDRDGAPLLAGWSENRGCPRRVPHSTQYRWSGAIAAPQTTQCSLATWAPNSEPEPLVTVSVAGPGAACGESSSAPRIVTVMQQTRVHSPPSGLCPCCELPPPARVGPRAAEP
jgi:hypothetical protein